MDTFKKYVHIRQDYICSKHFYTLKRRHLDLTICALLQKTHSEN